MLGHIGSAAFLASRAAAMLSAICAAFLMSTLPLLAAEETTASHISARHIDELAGVSFAVALPGATGRSQAQVEALILERPDVQLPPGLRYTSGVYAAGGVPFVLVWTRLDPVAPTSRDIERLALLDAKEAEARLGLSRFRFDQGAMRGHGDRAEAGGLRSRVLMQVAKGRTVFVGLFYEHERDGALFDRVWQSFVLDSAYSVRPDALAAGGLPTVVYVAAACALAAFGAFVVSRKQRRRST